MKRVVPLGLAAIITVCCSLFTASTLWAAGPIVLKAANQNPPSHPYNIAFEKFKKDVEEKTSGRVVIELYNSAQLGNERELIEQVGFGSVDFIVSASAPWANFIKDMMVFDLPFIFRDRPHAYAVLDGPIGQNLGSKLSQEGLIFLGFWENGFRHVSNSRNVVNTPEDMKGLKIRLMENPIHLATFARLGALPTPMAWPEVFTALQQKTIDGMENSPVIYMTANLYEVQKYLSLTGHFYSPAIFCVNEKNFKKLPADIQKIILECAEEAKHFQRKNHEDGDATYLSQLQEKGMTITQVDKKTFIEAVKPLFDEYGKKLGAQELIQQILDTK